MATVTPPYSERGVAAFEGLDTYEQAFLLNGSDPALSTGYPMPVEPNLTIPRWSVVGLNGAGQLVMATWDANPANRIKPVGVTTDAVTGNAGGTTTVGVIWRGHFNLDALNYDASFTTDEQKSEVFRGMDTPGQIIASKRP